MMRSSRPYLKIKEVTTTSFNTCREYARSIVRIAVKSCSKALLAGTLRHGKSPCFSRCSVFALVDVDYPSADSAVADVKKILE
jgi:hypothetical protein